MDELVLKEGDISCALEDAMLNGFVHKTHRLHMVDMGTDSVD